MSELIGAMKAATPTPPPAGYLALYSKDNGKWYYQTEAGVETELGLAYDSFDTGVITGCQASLNVDITKIDIAAGSYVIQGVSYAYAGITGHAPAFGVGKTSRHIGLAASGIVEQDTDWTVSQKQTILPICRVNAIQGDSGPGTTMLPPLHKEFIIGEVGYLLRLWHEEAIGVLYHEGGTISENGVTPLQLDEAVGVFYNAQRRRHVIAGSTNLQAIQLYHVGGVWVAATKATLVINVTQYDNGTGLVALGGNKWAAHTLLKAPKAVDEFFLIISPAQYDSEAAAQAAPAYYGLFQSQAASGLFAIANIVVKKNTVNINAIVDYRPSMSQVAHGTLGTANLQQIYENSSNPEIETDVIRGAFSLKQGSGDDTDDVLEVLNAAGDQVFSVTGEGDILLPLDGKLPAHSVSINKGVGNPSVSHLQYHLFLTGSSGYFLGGTLSDGGNGLLLVAAGEGMIRVAADSIAPLLIFAWSNTGIPIPDNTTQYVFVDNAGTVSISTNEFLEAENMVLLGVVTNVGGAIEDFFNLGVRLDESIGQAGRWMRRCFGVIRDLRVGGLGLGETGTRNITLSAGTLWWGRTQYPIAAIDTSGAGTFATYSSSGMEAPAATQWPNAQYDNAGTLTTLGNSKWASLWFYIEADDHLIMVYGTAEHNSQALAEAEGTPSSLPERLALHGMLVARLIFQRDATTGVISSAFATAFAGSGVAAHNDLSLLDGGAAGEYYHLTAAEYAALGASSDNLIYDSGELGSAVTSVTVSSGIDLDVQQDLDIVVEFYNPTGSTVNLSLYANNLQTSTDYEAQFNTANGNSVSAIRDNAAFLGSISAGGRARFEVHVGYGVGRRFAVRTECSRDLGASIISQSVNMCKIVELGANLTRLDFVGSAANSIGTDSRIRIYKRGA